jgi:hypothetical protein
MGTTFVLVHSPALGPRTWRPVAARLTALGHTALVPSLLSVGEREPPFWRSVVEAVRREVAEIPPDRPVVLVAHSNAGLFMPVIAAGVNQPVAASVFVDAALPSLTGATAAAPADLLAVLRGLADTDGRLPPWTEWWAEEEVAPLFPDPATRHAVAQEQPRLPISYFEQRIPGAEHWDGRNCTYLMFSPAYGATANEARNRGWPVQHLPGGHLHQLVDPDGVAAALAAAGSGG